MMATTFHLKTVITPYISVFYTKSMEISHPTKNMKRYSYMMATTLKKN
jgi:hypothetical protein